MILLTSCNWSKDSRSISKIKRTYEKHNGYKCQAEIRTLTGEKESVYLIEETYEKPNKYKLEILEPKKSKGMIILNTNEKISVEHPSIDQSINLVTIKSLNNQMLVGDFFQRISKAKLLSTDHINGDEYLVFQIKLEEKNKHRNTGKIWLKKKDSTPHKLNILDESGALRVEITYKKFKFIKKFIK